MAIKYAVLGLLRDRSSYPYELIQRFEERVGPTWDLNNAQIYQAIGQLERQELIERANSRPTAAASGRSWDFRITPRGEQAYGRWLAEETERVRPQRGDLLVKLALARRDEIELLLEAIERQEQLYAERLRDCSRLRGAMVPAQEARRVQELTRTLLVELASSHAELEMAWLQAVRRELQGYLSRTSEARAGAGPDGLEARRAPHRQGS